MSREAAKKSALRDEPVGVQTDDATNPVAAPHPQPPIEKILTLDEMAILAKRLKAQGKKIVLCHGTFDLLHTGHIRHLQRARQEGDVLLVTLTGDAFVNKGPGRPVFTEQLRAENLSALVCVDYVAINHAVTSENVIAALEPAVYVKGSDYKKPGDDITGNIAHEQQMVESRGGRVFYTDEITFSSSQLLNEHFNVFSPETRDYLRNFKSRFSEKDLRDMVKSLGKLNVLVVGDAIVDQYHYTTPLGQTGKGNIMAVRYDSEEQFAGGSIAVANHIAGFADRVTLVSGLGEFDSHEDFIRQKLLKNVSARFFTLQGAPTVIKRRFVDADLSKLFEVYFFREKPEAPEMEKAVCEWLNAHTDKYDLVVVPDFGNGFITGPMVRILCRRSKFLAVNTQINSGNRGFHIIDRYPHADFVSLNEPEIRLAAHNRHDPIEIVAEDVADQVQARQLAVTRGARGVMMLDRPSGEHFHVPALSTKVLDRIGAGDAFLSLAGLSLGGGLPAEVATFFGSAAAALDVQIVCNREPVSQVGLCKYVTTLLK